MSKQCDIARNVLRKVQLQTELDALRSIIKSQCAEVELPFAATIEDQVVTVKKPPYPDALPLTSVVPLHGNCDLLSS